MVVGVGLLLRVDRPLPVAEACQCVLGVVTDLQIFLHIASSQTQTLKLKLGVTNL
jgi:hypothetical protein